MTEQDYYEASRRVARLTPLKAQFSERQLHSYIEAIIAVKAHAWCMDVKLERHKMASLTVQIINELEADDD